VVATGIDNIDATRQTEPTSSLTELASRLRNENLRTAERIQQSAPRLQAAAPAPQPTARYIERPQPKPMPDYARTTAPRDIEAYGRLAAVRNSIEQAVLEIPAFLGRKGA
jgi:cell division protein FtsZ